MNNGLFARNLGALTRNTLPLIAPKIFHNQAAYNYRQQDNPLNKQPDWDHHASTEAIAIDLSPGQQCLDAGDAVPTVPRHSTWYG